VSREKRSFTAKKGLLTAFCVILLMVLNATAEAEYNNENNTSEALIFVHSDDTFDIILLQSPGAETQGTNTSQTIVLEIEDTRSQESPASYSSLALIILLLLVFSLLLIHILMHHTREDGDSATTPAPSLQGVKANPIGDGQPQTGVCEEDIFPLPLALSVLEAINQDCGPGASTRAPSMGYPVGYADIPSWEGTM